MRLPLFFALLTLAAQVTASELPTSAQVCTWAGFPPGFSLSTHTVKASDEKEGTLVAGVRIASDKSRVSYTIMLFAPGTYLRDRRKVVIAMMTKLPKLQKAQEKPGENWGPSADIGVHKTSKGETFYIIPGGMGPGGGAMMAFISTKQFDVVVEEYHSDEGHPLDKTQEEGVIPSKSLPEVFEAVLSFFAPGADAPS